MPEPDSLGTSSAGPAALRGSALRAGGYALGVLLTLVSAPILIRHLGVEGFGRYTVVVALVALVGGITEGGINAIAIREYAAGRGPERASTMRLLLGLRLAVTLLGIGLAVSFVAVAGYDDVLLLGTLVAGAGLLLQSTQSLLASSLQAALRFGWITVIDLGRQTVTVILIVALALSGAGLLAFFFVPAVAGALVLVVTAVLVRRHVPLRPAFSRRRWWGLLADTLPYAVATAINATYFRLAILLMSLIATERETGYFATSFRVIEVLLMVPALAIGAAFPILARAEREDDERFSYASGRILELSLLAGTFTALCVFLAAPVIIAILAGDDGEPAVSVLRLQAPALLGTFVSIAAGFSLLSMRRHRDILWANAAALCVVAALTLLLVPLLAADGAAIAASLAEFCVAGLTLGLLLRARPVLRQALAAAPAILAAGAAGASVALVPGLAAVIDVTVGAALFVVLIVLAGRFPPEVRDAWQRR